MANDRSQPANTLAPSLPSLLARMRESSTRTTKKFAERLSDAGLPILTGLEPPKPLPTLPESHFPTFQELVEQELTEPPEQEQNSGLFFQLVQDPRVLYRDYLDDPEKYNEKVGLLLQELCSGLKDVNKLKPEEAELLNLATVEYAQYSPKQEPHSKQPQPRLQRSAIPSDDESEVPWTDHMTGPNLPQTEVPVSLPDAPTFWWRK